MFAGWKALRMKSEIIKSIAGKMSISSVVAMARLAVIMNDFISQS
jgi:hypothetical protein